jgi:hypothetical protein
MTRREVLIRNLGGFVRERLDPCGESVQVSVRLTRAQLGVLDRARGELSRSEFIRRLVSDLEW